MEVKKTERGWAGHFCCSSSCYFRRNTLLEYKDIAIVVSTVGNMFLNNDAEPTTIGVDRYYETMAFHTDKKDLKYKDIDVNLEISFNSNWAISEKYKDNEANEMHEKVVNELIENIKLNKI